MPSFQHKSVACGAASSAAQVVVACVLLTVAWLLRNGTLYISAGLACVVPVVALIVGQLIGRRSIMMLWPAQVIGLCFSLFFLAGVVAVREGPGLLQHPSVRFVSDELITSTVIKLAALTTALVISAQFFGREALRRGDEANLLCRREFLVFSQILIAGALVGAGITIVSAGGLQQAGELLREHNKAAAAAVSDSVGIGLWKQLSPPGCVALSLLLVGREAPRGARRVALAELLVVVAVALVVFGSRLLVTQLLFGLGASYCVLHGRSVRVKLVIVAGVVMMVASLAVLGDRTSLTQNLNASDVASVAGYDLLNVSVSSVVVGEAIRSDVVDVSNLAAASEYVLPFLGVRGRDLNDSRVDVIVARNIDGGSVRRGLETGFPPSLPTVLLICLGFWGGLVGSVLTGAVIGWAIRWLGNRFARSHRTFDAFWISFFIVFVFNTFKDGDLLVGLASGARGVAILVVLEGTCLLLLGARRRRHVEIPAGPVNGLAGVE